MKPATKWNGQVHIKLALLAAITVSLSATFPARAVTITTDSTVAFYDHFENVSVGSLPGAKGGKMGLFREPKRKQPWSGPEEGSRLP